MRAGTRQGTMNSVTSNGKHFCWEGARLGEIGQIEQNEKSASADVTLSSLVDGFYGSWIIDILCN